MADRYGQVSFVLNRQVVSLFNYGTTYAGPAGPCIRSGSWNDSRLSNGNVQSTFIAFFEKDENNEYPHLPPVSYFFKRVAQLNDQPSAH